MPEMTMTGTNYREVKGKIHAQLLQEMDLESLNKLEEGIARARVASAIQDLLHRDRTPLTLKEREQLTREILNEVFGLGPIESLLEDSTVSDILVNGPDNIYVERRGVLERTNLFFNDSQHLMRIIERIVSRVGRRVDESSPMVDARLADGSRVNAIIPPLALDGPSMSIRRFGGHKLTADAFVNNGTLTPQMLELLQACVKGKLNVMVSGGTGAGKTTLLNILSSFIPHNERIVTIEDAAELRLNQPHVVRLETRPPNIEGKGAIRQRQLVINALRMRPDRIIVGEVRGEEAVDMLQAMNTGHEGSLTTIHANTPRDALSRLETMIAMAELNLPERAVRQQIASAINVIVQVSRLPDGSRKIISISEVTGMEGPVITTQELFVFERSGYDEKNRVCGTFRPTGIRPMFTERLQAHGIRFSLDAFSRDSRTGGRW
jgi:pilus assembly protein CpaF